MTTKRSLEEAEAAAKRFNFMHQPGIQLLWTSSTGEKEWVTLDRFARMVESPTFDQDQTYCVMVRVEELTQWISIDTLAWT